MSASKIFTEGYTATYTYNPIGNLLSKAENGPTLNYAYQDSAHKHAVTHLNNVQDYWYDANGNMTKRIEGGVTYTQTFDAENRLITVTTTSGTATFVYDGDGNRVKKTENGQTTVYVGALFEKNLTTNVTTSYYLASGQPVALRQNTTVSYLHGDHLGSTSLTTDSTGNVISRQKYLPFGQVRSTTGTWPTDKGFTGQRLDATGLMYYGARYYSSVLGRFISADAIVPGAGNPQTLNRYSYTLNNPLKYVDPSGHFSTDPCDYTPAACGGGGGGNAGGGGSSTGGSGLWETSPVNPCVASPSATNCGVQGPLGASLGNSTVTIDAYINVFDDEMYPSSYPQLDYYQINRPALKYMQMIADAAGLAFPDKPQANYQLTIFYEQFEKGILITGLHADFGNTHDSLVSSKLSIFSNDTHDSKLVPMPNFKQTGEYRWGANMVNPISDGYHLPIQNGDSWHTDFPIPIYGKSFSLKVDLTSTRTNADDITYLGSSASGISYIP